MCPILFDGANIAEAAGNDSGRLVNGDDESTVGVVHLPKATEQIEQLAVSSEMPQALRNEEGIDVAMDTLRETLADREVQALIVAREMAEHDKQTPAQRPQVENPAKRQAGRQQLPANSRRLDCQQQPRGENALKLASVGRRFAFFGLGLALLSVSGCSESSVGDSSTSAISESEPNIPPSPPAAPTRLSGLIGSVQKKTRARIGAVKLGSPFQVSFQAGWNLFSMPFSNPTTFSVTQPASVLACFSYNATTGAYVPQSFSQSGFTQQPGAPANQYQGYWVFCSTPVQLTLAGDDIARNPVQTNLVAG